MGEKTKVERFQEAASNTDVLVTKVLDLMYEEKSNFDAIMTGLATAMSRFYAKELIRTGQPFTKQLIAGGVGKFISVAVPQIVDTARPVLVDTPSVTDPAEEHDKP